MAHISNTGSIQILWHYAMKCSILPKTEVSEYRLCAQLAKRWVTLKCWDIWADTNMTFTPKLPYLYQLRGNCQHTAGKQRETKNTEKKTSANTDFWTSDVCSSTFVYRETFCSNADFWAEKTSNSNQQKSLCQRESGEWCSNFPFLLYLCDYPTS